MPWNETNIDDDDYVKIDSELEDEARSSFLMNQNPSMNLIIGGPQSTNTTGMTASKAKFTKESDQKRKQWTNMKCLKRLKQNTVGSSPHRSLGVVDDTLRTMVDIEVNRLYVWHMFPTKDIFWMRIAEEAILRGINVRSVRSDYTNLIVNGPRFYVAGRFC